MQDAPWEDAPWKMRLAARTLGSTQYGGFYVLPEEKIAQNTRISGQVVHKKPVLCTTCKVAACFPAK